AHNQQPEINTSNKTLDNDGGTFFECGSVCLTNLFAREKVGSNASPVVAKLWLDDNRGAQVFCLLPGLFCIGHGTPLRYRDSNALQQRTRQLFVLSDRFPNGTGSVCLRCQNASLARSQAKLDQAPAV